MNGPETARFAIHVRNAENLIGAKTPKIDAARALDDFRRWAALDVTARRARRCKFVKLVRKSVRKFPKQTNGIKCDALRVMLGKLNIDMGQLVGDIESGVTMVGDMTRRGHGISTKVSNPKNLRLRRKLTSTKQRRNCDYR